MLSDSEISAYKAKLSALGLEKVKENINNKIYHENMLPFVHQFVRDEEAKQVAIYQEETLRIAKEANDLSKEANLTSKKANKVSHIAQYISLCSLIVAGISAWIAYFK